jgi:uncharacterized protein (UPF0548 family)
MHAVSDFGREGRWARVGDRIVQRLHIVQLGVFAVVDVLTLNEITAVVAEARRKGFTYTTTHCHAEVGEWTAVVEWGETGEVALTMSAISRPGPRMVRWAHGWARQLQLRAHRLGLQTFARLVNQVADLPKP